MDIKTRVRNILVTPDTEWPVIAAETTPTRDLIVGYVVPLAAIGAIAGFIGGSLVGFSVPYLGTYRVPIVSGLASAIFAFAMAIAGVFILSFIIDALAPTFGGQKNQSQALKLAAYSYTPAWLAAVFQILPPLAILALIGALYGFYLLYRGIPVLMKSPPDKAIAYTAVVIVAAIVLYFIIAAISGLFVSRSGGMGMGMAGAGAREVQFDPNSPMGKLEALGKELEKSNEKVEAARRSGDTGAEAAAAMEGLGALLGGGKRVDPVSADQLAAFVPDSFAGLPRTSRKAEKAGMPGLQVTTAEATYSDDSGKSIDLEITDTGGIGGLTSLASWAGGEGQEDNEDRTERTERVDGRMVHTSVSKRGGDNEFSIVIADRFVVTARGPVDIGGLKSAVSALDLSTLETLKKS